jgi:hypothetical protein
MLGYADLPPGILEAANAALEGKRLREEQARKEEARRQTVLKVLTGILAVSVVYAVVDTARRSRRV